MEISDSSASGILNADISMKDVETTASADEDDYTIRTQLPTVPPTASSSMIDDMSVSSVLFGMEISANSTMISSDDSGLLQASKKKQSVKRHSHVPQNTPDDSESGTSVSYDDDEYTDASGSEDGVRCEFCGCDLFNSAFDESTEDEENGVDDLSAEIKNMAVSANTSVCTPCKKRARDGEIAIKTQSIH